MLFLQRRQYQADERNAVSLTFDIRYGRGKKPLRVSVLIDESAASRFIFIPDSSGEWHKKADRFNAAAAYAAFIPGVLAAALIPGAGVGQSADRLLWRHRCLLSFLAVEAKAAAVRWKQATANDFYEPNVRK